MIITALLPKFPAASAPATLADVQAASLSVQANSIPVNGPNYRWNNATGELQLHNSATGLYSTVDTTGALNAETLEISPQQA